MAEEQSVGLTSADELAAPASEDSAPGSASQLVFPDWFVGDWACAAELFKVDEGGGDLMLAAAVPGAQEGLVTQRSALGTSSAIRREVRRWGPAPGAGGRGAAGALEEARSAPSGVWAAALALSGPGASVPAGAALVNASAQGAPTAWTAQSPKGWQWRLKVASAAVGEQEGEEKYRAREFYRAESISSPIGNLASAVVRVSTAYRRVPPEQSATGLFKIGLGTVDASRRFIIQAIQTTAVLAAPRGPDGKRTAPALATYKSRLLFSPIIPGPA